MLEIVFSDEEKKALHYERFNHPHPRVQQRMEALWLKSHGLPHAQIAELVGVSQATLHEYLMAYKEGGIERLKVLNWRGSVNALAGHQDTLKNFFCKILRPQWPPLAKRSPN
jgi:hypothetical protein